MEKSVQSVQSVQSQYLSDEYDKTICPKKCPNVSKTNNTVNLLTIRNSLTVEQIQELIYFWKKANDLL